MEAYDEYLLANKREIVITGEITEELAIDIFKRLRFVDDFNMQTKGRKKKPQDITVWINSCGGDIAAANMIYETFDILHSDIRMIGIGHVASAAMDIFVAGTKGKRFCYPYTMFMIHNLRGGTFGGYDDMANRMKFFENLQKQGFEHLLNHSDLNNRQLKRMLKDSETWFGAEKAIEHGFVDAVLEEPL